MKLEISKIRTDGNTQARLTTYPDVVKEYAEVMEEWECKGAPRFPRVLVYFDGEHYWLVDGFHRIAAALKCKLYEIDCEIKEGTQREARFNATKANTDHGLPRNREDKRIAVRILLEDEEWRQMSNRAIAEHCEVSDTLVGDIRDFLYPATTVKPQSNPVRVGRDGRTYNTTNIGKTKRQQDLHEHFNPPVTEIEPVPPKAKTRQTTVEELLRPDGKTQEDMTEMPPEPKPVPPDPGYTQRLDDEALLAAQSRFVHLVKKMRDTQRRYFSSGKNKDILVEVRALEKRVDAELETLLKNYEF